MVSTVELELTHARVSALSVRKLSLPPLQNSTLTCLPSPHEEKGSEGEDEDEDED